MTNIKAQYQAGEDGPYFDTHEEAQDYVDSLFTDWLKQQKGLREYLGATKNVNTEHVLKQLMQAGFEINKPDPNPMCQAWIKDGLAMLAKTEVAMKGVSRTTHETDGMGNDTVNTNKPEVDINTDRPGDANYIGGY